MSAMSTVWNYASKRKNPITKELEARCEQCNKIIKCSGNSTTTLKKHLKLHNIDIDIPIQPSTSKEPVKEKKAKAITDFLSRQSLKEIVSDLATDGISVRAITRNNYIRKSLFRDGYKLPATERDVMKLLHDDYDEKRANLIESIKEKLENRIKFSMCVDEYTTTRGRRFFGVNLHGSDNTATIKTGLVRIHGSCSAFDMIRAMEQHLEDFGISMSKDIVGSTQDGAAVNKKYIRHIDVIGQFCLNHAIHLGICDTLYRKKVEEKVDDKIEKIVDEKLNKKTEIDEVDYFDDGIDVEVVSEVVSEDEIEQELVYHRLLENSRQLVRFIKKSTVRNNVFLSKVKQELGHEIELHIDVKTRWNSITTMLEPLVKTENAIRETLLEFNALNLIEAVDFSALKILLKATEPVKLAVENLGREDATLLSAEKILNFMFDKLENLNTDISKKLAENLKIRVNERMNEDVLQLLRSLKDPTITPSKTTLIFGANLASRLFDDSVVEVQQNVNNDKTENLSLQDELNILLQENDLSVPYGKSDFKSLKSEFIHFKNTGQRTEKLQNLYDAILTIKPTSIDVERVFSVCSSFCTKIRSRLSDKSLQALVFLKYFYKK